MKRKLIICNIFIVLVLLCTSVYAATTAKLNLVTTPDNAQIKAGEKFTVKISLKDFGKNVSVDTVSGYIDIDENIIEDITIANIVKTSGNIVKIGKENLEVYDVANITGIPETGIFLAKDPATDDGKEHDYKITIALSIDNKISTEDIIKIEFETKDNLKEDTYNNAIKFAGFAATSGWTESVSIEDESVSVIIKNAEENKDDENKDDENKDDGNKDDGNKDDGNKNDGNKDDGNKDDGNKNDGNKNDGNKNDGNKNDGNKDNGNKDNGNKDNGNKDNTIANKIIPAAGTTSVIVRILAVALISGFVVYIKYKKYKNI